MYVKSVELKNFKVISELQQDFNGGIYLFKAKNEKGKTTAIEAMITMLTGDRSDNLLQQGKEKGFGKMVVGEENDPNGYEVELKFSEKNPRGTIRVTHLETGMKSDNKSFLQGLFKYQEFDANEFVRWSDSADGRRKQVKIIKSLLPPEIVKTFEELEVKINDEKEDRKGYNSTATYLTGKIDNLVDLSILEKEKPNKEALELERKNAYEKNQDVTKGKETLLSVKADLVELPTKAQNLIDKQKQYNTNYAAKVDQIKADFNRRLADAKLDHDKIINDNNNDFIAVNNKIAELKLSKTKIEIWLNENKEVSLDAIAAKIETANEFHTKLAVAKIQKEKKEELAGIHKSIENSNESIESYTSQKAVLLKENPLPIEGLAFDDEGLVLNGIKVRKGDISTSQEIELAVNVLMAKNQKVKVFKISQGESLDNDKFKRIVKFAEDNGYQGFVEMMERTESNLVIEEYKELD